ncbi:hypothetical protein [Hymenobacter sp. CRA2]|uniref:hypothetical protein n=1 Tax=Hymenobacter sp. CRA2 TaxID=1955620 RepID=UPI00098F8BB9|nr:hypothetical protein [Hymenobacter sp. CRA2]OON67760.1 hypothetical protein B0919_16305 [Hymenobacter sp. CRA2]
MPYNTNPLRALTPQERQSPLSKLLLQGRLQDFHRSFVQSRGPEPLLTLYGQALAAWIEHPATDVDHVERLFDHIALHAPEADAEDWEA